MAQVIRSKSNLKPKAIIISPTYNERPNIKKLIPILAGVIAEIKNWQVELLVVDDTSPDKTYEEVQDLQKKYKFVHLLINKKKAGLGGAYLKGMKHAINDLGADVVFEMDADLSHDPKKIPAFLRALDNGADVVLGSRYVEGGSIPANWGLHRKFLSVAGNTFISVIMMSRQVKDWTGGFRAIRKEVYQAVSPELNSQRFSGYTFQIGFLVKALRKGFKVTEIPFHFVDRTYGESKLGTEYIINTLRFILALRLQELLTNRIVKFVIVGGIGFVVNLLFYQLFKYFQVWSWFTATLQLNNLPSLLSGLFSNEGLAVALAAEVAIVSNYILNNFWTFKDRKISGLWGHFNKFLQFNFGSLGSVVIQYLTMQIAVSMFGIFSLFSVFGVSITVDNLYLVAGVLLGMIWNFTIYSKVIWRNK